nr:putative reverse transcriptase domain-containing protein [Tanacetum cinerariifolium]
MARECSFTGFMKCGPTQFYGTEGSVKLVRWFEMENTFEISKCAKGMKVKFSAATLHGRALTWWNSQCENCGRMGHEAKDCQSKNVASGATVQPNVVCYECRERGHKCRAYPKKANHRGGNVQGQAYVIRDAEQNQGPNVVMGIDRLVERDALIVCGKKEVYVPYKNKTLVVKSDSSVSRLKVISCIKARKYIERGSHLFIAQVMKKEPAKKQLQDVPVIRNFPEVFLDDLPRLPPPRQVEFKIKLILGAAPIACAPYRLASSEQKELSNQLRELSEKGFVRSSSSL